MLELFLVMVQQQLLLVVINPKKIILAHLNLVRTVLEQKILLYPLVDIV